MPVQTIHALLSMIIGMAATGLLVVSVVRWQRRRRRLHGESPKKDKLLRPPGHTLSGRLENYQDKVWDHLTITVGAGAVLGPTLLPLIALLLNAELWIRSESPQRMLLA